VANIAPKYVRGGSCPCLVAEHGGEGEDGVFRGEENLVRADEEGRCTHGSVQLRIMMAGVVP
jgi:hypothetical protein